MKSLLKAFLITAVWATSVFHAGAYVIDDYTTAMRRGDYNQAIAIMNDIISHSDAKTGDYYYKRACAYEKNGNFVYAAIDCETALRYSAENKDYYLLRARCKYKINDPTYINDAKNAGEEGLAMIEKSKHNGRNHAASISSNPLRYSESVKPSDVDINIPMTFHRNENSFVLIICVENYLENNISKVDYAINDGRKFKEYCIKTLGIPEENIQFRADATLNQFRQDIKWVNNRSDIYGNKANLIVYYSGHGMPDERSRKAYLLPADGIANDPESGYSLAQLFNELGEMDFNSSLVLLDACFSGSKKDGGMLTKSKGVAIKPDPEELTGNVAVLSATQADDTAYFDEDNSHGMFTYFILKKLQRSKGNVTISELADYVTDNVKKASVLKKSKMQSPTVEYSCDSSVDLGKVNLLRK